MVACFCALDQLPSPCTYARAAEVKPEHKKTSPSIAKKMQTKTNTMNCSFLEIGTLRRIARKGCFCDLSVVMPVRARIILPAGSRAGNGTTGGPVRYNRQHTSHDGTAE